MCFHIFLFVWVRQVDINNALGETEWMYNLILSVVSNPAARKKSHRAWVWVEVWRRQTHHLKLRIPKKYSG